MTRIIDRGLYSAHMQTGGIARSPARRLLYATTLVGVMLAMTGCTSALTHAGATPSATQPGASSPGPSVVPTPSAGGAPLAGLDVPADAVVASDRSGNVVAIAPDGSVTRTLIPDVVTGGPPGHVRLSADGSTVYFDRGRPGCWLEFAYDSGDGGPSAPEGDGSWPSPNANGSLVAAVTGADSCHPDTLEILSLTATPRTWRLSAALRSQGFQLTGPLAWSADGKLLSVPMVSGRQHRVLILTVDTPGTQLTGSGITPLHAGGSVDAAFFVTGGLITLESCCGTTPTYQLEQRTLSGTTAGKASAALTIAQPVDIDISTAGRIAIVTAAGHIAVGVFPHLAPVNGTYVAVAIAAP